MTIVISVASIDPYGGEPLPPTPNLVPADRWTRGHMGTRHGGFDGDSDIRVEIGASLDAYDPCQHVQRPVRRRQ